MAFPQGQRLRTRASPQEENRDSHSAHRRKSGRGARPPTRVPTASSKPKRMSPNHAVRGDCNPSDATDPTAAGTSREAPATAARTHGVVTGARRETGSGSTASSHASSDGLDDDQTLVKYAPQSPSESWNEYQRRINSTWIGERVPKWDLESFQGTYLPSHQPPSKTQPATQAEGDTDSFPSGPPAGSHDGGAGLPPAGRRSWAS